jgi:hypothetical protein
MLCRSRPTMIQWSAVIDRLVGWLERVDVRRLGIGIGAAIVAVVAVGTVQLAQMHYDLGGPRVRGFNLDGEWNVATAVSVALVAWAALLSFVLAGNTSGHPRRGVLVAFGVLLTFLSLDDALEVHERLADRTDVEWQVLYLPLAVVGAVVFLLVWRDLREFPPAHLLLTGAAGAWFVAQAVFERVQRTPGYRLTRPWSIAPEEALEMIGAALIAFALLTTLQDLARDPGATDPRGRGRHARRS